MSSTTDIETPTARATLRYLRVSPYKVREVLGLIRGLDVERARDVLQFCERAVSHEVGKLLDSAVANAESNLAIPADELKVAIAYADEGPTLKRWRPRARGRATRIRKRTSHVTIVVERLGDEELTRKSQRRDAGDRSRRVEGGRRRRRRGAEAAEAAATPVTPEATEVEVSDASAGEGEVEVMEVEAVVDAEAVEGSDVEASEASAAEEPTRDVVADDEQEEG